MENTNDKIRAALKSCQTGGYTDIDGDRVKTYSFDEKLVAEALASIDAAPAPAAGADHLSPENIRALVMDLEAIAMGEASIPACDRDWVTWSGIIAKVIQHLGGAPAPVSDAPAAGDDERRFDKMTGAFYRQHTRLPTLPEIFAFAHACGVAEGMQRASITPEARVAMAEAKAEAADVARGIAEVKAMLGAPVIAAEQADATHALEDLADAAHAQADDGAGKGYALSINGEEDFKRLVVVGDFLADHVGDNEAHPLFPFFDTVMDAIKAWEDVHVDLDAALAQPAAAPAPVSAAEQPQPVAEAAAQADDFKRCESCNAITHADNPEKQCPICAAAAPAAQPTLPDDERAAAEARQRKRMAEKFASRAPSPATADFDLPAPNDEPVAYLKEWDSVGCGGEYQREQRMAESAWERGEYAALTAKQAGEVK